MKKNKSQKTTAQLLAENEQFRAEIQQLLKRCQSYEEQHAQLYAQLQALRRKVFGAQSERHVDANSPQFDLFSKVSDQASPEADEDDKVISIAAYQRKKKKRDRWAHLPLRTIDLPVSDTQRQCHCGQTKVTIGYDVSMRLHHIPAVFERLEERREKVACPKGCEHSVDIAPLPPRALPKISVTEELLAHIITSKVEDRQPLYHLEQKSQKADQSEPLLSRQVMADWMIDAATVCQPIINLLQDDITDYDICGLDATTLQVLREPNRQPETKSLVFCWRGGCPERPITLYHYNATTHKPFLSNWLAGLRGWMHCDADPLFEDLETSDGIQRSFCHAHARRKFEPIVKQAKKPGQAHRALDYFRKLYRIEREAKKKKLTPAQRFVLRAEKSKPIMAEFHDWLIKIQPHVLRKSELARAVNYCLNHWQGLHRFLDDGRLEIDNNLTEQAIKPFVMGRKNFLFACTPKGAQALCIHFSLVRTAKQNGIDPYDYYVKLLKGIPYCKTSEDYEKLLPWNINQQQTTKQKIA